MNNLSFTKDELLEIKRCLNYMIKRGIAPCSSLTSEIKKKTQYLIQHIDRHQKIAERFEEWNK